MYKLFLSDRTIILDKEATGYKNGEYLTVTPDDPIVVDKAKLLQKVQNTKKLILISEEADTVFDRIVSQFSPIYAGGGVTTNEHGEILMIFRHTRWDLPKGKLEPGENIEECALREVTEECGVDPAGLALGKFLTETFHLYQLNGEWIVKKTSWYAMTYTGKQKPTPQTEEDITALEWVNPAKLDTYLRTTYPTIVDVFAAAGFHI